MRSEQVHHDITVVGGGLAGVCAAIAAARRGRSVALVQNRPVLGGNSSSEIRVWVCGGTAHGVQRNARETGIMGELFVENQYRNIDGNPYYWDLTVEEAVRAERNIDLYLNTDIFEVAAIGPRNARTIESVTGWMQGSERRITFTSDVFCDCSGDGLVGLLAGAEFMTGRESRALYGEPWAPETPDQNTLGSTILFYSKDAGHPVRFVPPPYAKNIADTSIPEHRVIRETMNGCDYWWIEWGGEHDIVSDNEMIRDELKAVVYGIWDYIKNSGRFNADTLTLEWIGSVPGKREYRRLLGDYVLTQHDITNQTDFFDMAAYGGWSIDLHPPGGVYATGPGSLHWHPDGNYSIPLRTLYSRNVRNLWMAGRNISATHVAFGSTRVMATCAILGEAAGLGAAVAIEQGVDARELVSSRLDSYRSAQIHADASVIGLINDDPADLVRSARVSASSFARRVAVEDSTGSQQLTDPIGLVFPVAPGLKSVSVLVDAARDTMLRGSLHHTSKPQNYLPADLIAAAEVPVPAGKQRWIRLDLDWQPKTPAPGLGPVGEGQVTESHGAQPQIHDTLSEHSGRNAFVRLDANPDLSIHHGAAHLPGLLALRYNEPPDEHRYTEQWRAWKRSWEHDVACVQIAPPSDAYSPARARGGYARPFGGPQMWVSQPLDRDPEPWWRAEWSTPVELGEVMIVFDDDVDIDLINLHHHRTEFEVIPSLVRDYAIDLRIDGEWRTVLIEEANRKRTRRHFLDASADGLRIRVLATNGARRARIVAVRGYVRGQTR